MIHPLLPKSVLFVEDSQGYQLLIQEAFDLLNLSVKLTLVSTAEEAIEWLKLTSNRSPDLIFLDLHLPKMSGHDLLKIIKKNPKTKGIPVFILSASSHPEDVLKSYQLQANCHLKKPSDIDSFLDCLQTTFDFWFSVATLPTTVLTSF